MKILWITLESILPANTGGRIGVFKRLEQLSKSEEIYLFYPYDSKKDEEYIKVLKKYCKEVHAYNRNKNKFNAIKLLLKYPYTVGSRCFADMQIDINKCLQNNKIDIINVDFPHMLVNLLNIKINKPVVLNEHNIEWKVYQKISKSHSNIVKKIAYFIDSKRLKKYESNIIEKIPINIYTFVSDEDKDNFINEHNIYENNCVHVPIGAEIKKIKKGTPTKIKNIIFVGKMSYGPNIEAAISFSRNVFPIIEKKIKNVKFYIVGKEPSEKLKQIENNNIIITGSVESVDSFYDMADLVVIPLKNGGGAKIKLLEAIGHCKPLVSTTVGVEGTEYRHNGLVPIADDDNTFAERCIYILNNEYEASIQAVKAYNFLKEKYSWEKIGVLYKKILYSIVRR